MLHFPSSARVCLFVQFKVLCRALFRQRPAHFLPAGTCGSSRNSNNTNKKKHAGVHTAPSYRLRHSSPRADTMRLHEISPLSCGRADVQHPHQTGIKKAADSEPENKQRVTTQCFRGDAQLFVFVVLLCHQQRGFSNPQRQQCALEGPRHAARAPAPRGSF